MEAHERPSTAAAGFPMEAHEDSDAERLAPRLRGGGRPGRGSSASALGRGFTRSPGGKTPGSGRVRPIEKPRVPSGPLAYRIPRSTIACTRLTRVLLAQPSAARSDQIRHDSSA